MIGVRGPHSHLLALACLLLPSACGGPVSASAPVPQEPETSSPAQEKKSPEDIQKLFAREAPALAKQPVSSGAWSSYIEAKSAPHLEVDDNLVTITADVGWEMELRCYVYDRVIDAGGAANTMIKAAAKSVNFKALQAYYFDHDGLSPMIGLRGIYNVEQNGVLLAGDYKLLIMPRLEYPVLCEHDAPGYAVSFARVASEFAKSFKFPSKQAKPQRGELWAVTLEGSPVGFTQNITLQLDGGQMRQTTLAARFVPRGPGEILFEDEATVVTSDKKGGLVNGKYLSYENGEPTLVMDIERTAKGYDYIGTIQDKELRGSFKTKQPLLSEYALLKRLKSLASAPKKTAFEQWEYTPGVDPANATKVSYAVTPEDGAMAVSASTGQRGLIMKVNASGVVGQVLMPVGAQTVQADLVEEVGGL